MILIHDFLKSHAISRVQRLVVIWFVVLAFPNPTLADVLFEITGMPGSPEVTLSLSGSLVYVDQTTSTSQDDETDFLRFPLVGNGKWFTPSSDWSGDYLWNTSVAEQFWPANSSDMMLSITGDFQQDYTFDSIYMSSGRDGYFIPYNSFVQGTYPVLGNADLTFSVSGSASVTLPDGLTFDDFNLGTRESGFPYQDNLFQAVSIVPEPRSLILTGIAGLLLVSLRKNSA